MSAVLDTLRALAAADGTRAQRARQAAEAIRAARNYRWVGLYDVGATHISAIAWTGAQAPAFPAFPVSAGLSGAAVASGTPVVVPDVRKDPRYLTTFGATRSEAIVPVKAGARVVGTIDVESVRVGAFGVDDELFLNECAQALAALWT